MIARSHKLGSVALLVGFLLAATANAEPSKSDIARADSLFAEGKAAMKRSDFVGACARFTQSKDIDPAAGTFRWLSECEEKQGKFVLAQQHLRDALDQHPDDDMRRLCEQQATALIEHAPKLKVTVAGAETSEGTLSIDGHEISADRRKKPIVIDAGDHVVELVDTTSPDGKKRSRTITVASGETTDVDFADDATSAEPRANPHAPHASATSSSGGSVWPYVVGGIGIAGFGVATVAGLHLASVKSEISGCRTTTCTASQVSDGVSAKGVIPVYYAGLVVGVVGVGLGVTLLLTSGGDDKASASLRVGPGSVAIGGRF